MKALLGRLGREPAALGAAVLAWIAVANPSPGVMAAATATVGWLIRSFSTSKAAVDEAKAAGYDKAIADVSSLQSPPRREPGPPPIPPERGRA